jgi:tetratricopeptide (TPR) repeat protein
VICLLGAGAFTAWLRQAHPSKRSVDRLLANCSCLIATRHWEQALTIVRPLCRRQLGGVRARILCSQIYRATHQLHKALEMIELGLKEEPQHLGLLLEQGKILLQLKRPQKALDALGQCVPVLRSCEDHLDLATALFQTGHIDAAWSEIEPLLAKSQTGRAFALAGDILFANKQYSDALMYYFKAKHSGWDSHRIAARLGYAFLGTAQYDEAERRFLTILEKDPTDIASTLGMGACQEIYGNYKDALDIYQDDQVWALGNSLILRQAGYCAVHAGQYAFAELYLDAAIKKGSSCPKALAFLAYSRECQGKWEAAEETYFQLVKNFPDEAAGYRGLAWLFGIGHSHQLTTDSGIAMAEEAIARQPDASSWELLSACEARAGNFNRAHDIQERLSFQEGNGDQKQRRRQAMRALRKGQPLNATLVYHHMVA